VSRALVLGGGGVTGVAWEVGVLAGLAAAGVDLRAADVVVGTSAGSSVGAQVTSGTGLEELYERQVSGPATEIPARLGIGAPGRYTSAMVRHRKHPEAGRAHLGAAGAPRRRRSRRPSGAPSSPRAAVARVAGDARCWSPPSTRSPASSGRSRRATASRWWTPSPRAVPSRWSGRR
jgi:hypothetical protein